MPAIALKTPKPSLLAFVLIAGPEELREGSTLRQSILAGAPQDSSDIENPLTLARTEHLHVEHRTNVHAHDDGIDIFISIAKNVQLAISLNIEGSGTWSLAGSFGTSVGICELAKPTNEKSG